MKIATTADLMTTLNGPRAPLNGPTDPDAQEVVSEQSCFFGPLNPLKISELEVFT